MKSWRIIILISMAVACVSAAMMAQQVQPPLPEPTQARPNFGQVVPRPEGAMPKVPNGFLVDMYADNVASARIMTFTPNDDLFVAQTS